MSKANGAYPRGPQTKAPPSPVRDWLAAEFRDDFGRPSVTVMAERTGYHKVTVHRWLKRGKIPLAEARRLAQRFDINPEQLAGGSTK